MMLTARFLLGATILSALVGAFVQDNYEFGASWQIKHAEESLFYQQKYAHTLTEYEAFIDESLTRLGHTLTQAFKHNEPVLLLSNLLYVESIKHKAHMDAIDDYLTFIGHPPTLYQDFMYKQAGDLDWEIALACSDFGWTFNPLASQEEQLVYFAQLLFDHLAAWNLQYMAANQEIKTYLAGIGEIPPEFELWQGNMLRMFPIYWIDVLNDYR